MTDSPPDTGPDLVQLLTEQRDRVAAHPGATLGDVSRRNRAVRDRVLDSLVRTYHDAEITAECFGQVGLEAAEWAALSLRVQQLSDLVESGLFDRIDAGGPERDAIERHRAERERK